MLSLSYSGFRWIDEMKCIIVEKEDFFENWVRVKKSLKNKEQYIETLLLLCRMDNAIFY